MSNAPDDVKTAPAKPGSIATPTMKRGLKGFIADTKREMKKVNWPSRGETNRLTFVVLALVVIIATMLSVSSWIADSLVTIIMKGHA